MLRFCFPPLPKLLVVVLYDTTAGKNYALRSEKNSVRASCFVTTLLEGRFGRAGGNGTPVAQHVPTIGFAIGFGNPQATHDAVREVYHQPVTALKTPLSSLCPLSALTPLVQPTHALRANERSCLCRTRTRELTSLLGALEGPVLQSPHLAPCLSALTS